MFTKYFRKFILVTASLLLVCGIISGQAARADDDDDRNSKLTIKEVIV